MARSSKQRLIIAVILTALTVSVGNPLSAQSHGINEMSLERWAKLREVERHQLKIAEKYFLEKSWSIAADEYDKYLTLYESSDAASYVMLKWSLCQVEMRRQNTAIKDGFQSVIDYWPESDDAIAASYYKGKTLKDIGQNEKAKPALQQVLEDHPKHHVSVYAAVQLAEIAALEDNLGDKIKQWRHLTFDVIRDNATSRWCQEASQHLASHQLAHDEFDEAVKALATTYDAERLPLELVNRSQSVLEKSMRESATASQGNRLADQLIQFLREQEPAELDDASAKSAATQLLYLIARVQRVVNRDEDVLKTFGEIANRFGADDELLSQTAEYYQAKQNFDKARQAFRNFKNQPDGLSRVARSYRQEKNPELAILTYAQLVSIDPEQTAVWKAEMAMTYREASKHAEAIKIYEALLNEDREHSDKWLWETAMTYRDDSKWKEAIGFFRQSDQFPNNYREMAWCHRRLKQYGEAVILYNQIAGGHESSAPWAVLQIGYTEEEAGNQERAITAFKKVCKQFPKDRHASQAHAHLQNKYKLSVTLGGAKQD